MLKVSIVNALRSENNAATILSSDKMLLDVMTLCLKMIQIAGKCFTMRKEWTITENHRARMYDCVRLYKEQGYYSIFRCIDDWDEEGTVSPYNAEEYLNLIPDTHLQQAIGATTDNEVVRWVKKHLIKDQSNSLDAIEEFLKDRNIHFTYSSEYTC